MAATYELLKSASLTSSASSISLSSIPQTYTDLVLVFSTAQTSAFGQVFMGSTSSNPVQIGLTANSPTSAGYTAYSTTQWAPFFNSNVGDLTSRPTQGIINIFSYCNPTSAKNVIWLNQVGNNNLRAVFSVSENADSTDLTSIVFDGNGQQFLAGTRVRLYGILRA